MDNKLKYVLLFVSIAVLVASLIQILSMASVRCEAGDLWTSPHSWNHAQCEFWAGPYPSAREYVGDLQHVYEVAKTDIRLEGGKQLGYASAGIERHWITPSTGGDLDIRAPGTGLLIKLWANYPK